MVRKVVIEIEFPSESKKADLDYTSAVRFLRESGFKVRIIREFK